MRRLLSPPSHAHVSLQGLLVKRLVLTGCCCCCCCCRVPFAFLRPLLHGLHTLHSSSQGITLTARTANRKDPSLNVSTTPPPAANLLSMNPNCLTFPACRGGTPLTTRPRRLGRKAEKLISITSHSPVSSVGKSACQATPSQLSSVCGRRGIFCRRGGGGLCGWLGALWWVSERCTRDEEPQNSTSAPSAAIHPPTPSGSACTSGRRPAPPAARRRRAPAPPSPARAATARSRSPR